MDDIDQRRFDNQRSSARKRARPRSAPPGSPDWLPAAEAARRLGVKLATLYSYASRGLVRSVPGLGSRARRYAREDVERLRTRHDARAGHGAVAAGALRWGEPVLDSSITEITSEGPRYRGELAVELARRGVAFERVAELLWTGVLPPTDVAWHPAASAARAAHEVARLRRRESGPLSLLSSFVAAMALVDGGAPVVGSRELPLARALIAALPLVLTPERHPARAVEVARGRADGDSHTALRIADTLGARTRSRDARRALDAALVLVADHELNASTFATRVAASAGADLHACLLAGLATLSGPRHGGMCDRVEALAREAGTPRDAGRVVAERLRRGETLPGFGHPFYPAGDPRAVPLLEAARGLARKRSAAHVVLALVAAMRQAGGEPATIDLGLVAVAHALDLPTGSAAALFAIGRSAGWIAHAREQRESGVLLRPRARYVAR